MSRRVLPTLLRLGRSVRAHLFAPRVAEEVREELDFHVRMRARELEATGMSPDEALREAERRVRGRERAEAECLTLGEQREARMRGRAWGEAVGQDLGFALRQLRRHPVFAATAIVTLGLGIGANTAVFSAVRGVLLRPLPYRAPEELVALNTRYLPISGFDLERFPLSIPELKDYREQSKAMVGAAPYITRAVTLGGDDGMEPARMGAGYVSAELFPLLGVTPLLGRSIAPEEDVPGAPPVIVLSHGLWIERFGGDAAVVGRAVTFGGRQARVVGVMPEEFVFPTADQRLWSPLGLDWTDDNRAGHFISAVGRLAPGVTVEEAQAELETIAQRWAQEYQHSIGHFITGTPFQRDLIGDVGKTLLLLQAAVALVLLVACVNVANLSLARAEGRRHELAVRASLGAGRGRVARQLLTESLVLALAGAGAGWLLASRGSALLTALDPGALPRGDSVRMDGGVLVFSIVLAVGAALLFGCLPALRATKGGPARDLVGGARGGAALGSRRLQRTLVAAEVALSVVVVVAAGLITRSLAETLRVDTGMRTERLLTAPVAVPIASYPEDAQTDAFFAALEQRIRAIPGVTDVSAVSSLPLSGTAGRFDFFIVGREPLQQGERVWNAFVAAARPGYFETVGIPLVAGRTLLPSDGADAEPVVWINRRTAELFWPGEDPVGAQIIFSDQSPVFRIAGIVGGTPPTSLRDEPEPQLYFAHAQLGGMGGVSRGMNLMIRTAIPTESVAAAVRAAVREQDPRLPAPEVVPMERVILKSAARPRITAGLLGGFGVLALLLAAVGVYGVASYSVARRTREIGIRVALGARSGRISRLVLAQGLAPAALGLVVGLAAAVAATPRLEGLLFRVSPRDPVTLTVIPAVLLLVAALASWIPARRALRIAPTEALKEE